MLVHIYRGNIAKIVDFSNEKAKSIGEAIPEHLRFGYFCEMSP